MSAAELRLELGHFWLSWTVDISTPPYIGMNMALTLKMKLMEDTCLASNWDNQFMLYYHNILLELYEAFVQNSAHPDLEHWLLDNINSAETRMRSYILSGPRYEHVDSLMGAAYSAKIWKLYLDTLHTL